MSATTIASLALALAAVAAALGAVLATRPVLRRVRAAVPPPPLPPWVRHRRSPGLLVLLAGAAVAFALVAVFTEILDAVVENDDLAVADQPTVQWLAHRRPEWSNGAVVALTDLGGKVLLTALLAGTAAAAAIRLRSWRPLLLATVAGGGSVLLVAAVKALIARDRPGVLHRAIFESGFSFPSGHAANSLVVLGTVAWLVGLLTAHRTARATAWVAAGILTAAVGVSRVYLGVHYPSDVLAGWLLGATWLVTVAVAARLPESPVLPLIHRWRHGEPAPERTPRRPAAVFLVAATAGLITILATVSLAATTS